MTPRQFCDSAQSNGLKGAVHGVMLVGAVACAVYNLAAFYYRRETHNAVNGVVYLGLTILEWEHLKHHARPAA